MIDHFKGRAPTLFFASFDRSVYLLFWTSYRPELIVCKGGLVCAHSNYGIIHGLRTLNEDFFSLKSRTFVLGPTNWADKFWGIWGILGRTISTHFVTVSPLSMFFIIQPLFLQTTEPLYPHWDLNLDHKEFSLRSPWGHL